MENKKINILVVEDNLADLRLVSEMLKDCAFLSFGISWAGRLNDALEILSQESIDAVLLDLHLPDGGGLINLEKIIAKYPQLPVILLTGFNDGNIGLEAVQRRAADYLVKGQINSELIVRSIQYAIERKREEKEREITIEFLRIVNLSSGVEDLIRKAATFFQEKSDCHAVGVRLKQGQDYPYFEARGFPKEFILAENFLCARDNAGELMHDSTGNPIIECMCGNVICARFDARKPFFTNGGSFWTNSTTELLSSTTEADRQSRTRNRCNGEGYESVALIPLRVGQERLGLLQLNDRSKGKFNLGIISFWERLADYLSVALAKLGAEKSLRESEERYRCLVDMSPEAVFINRNDKIVFVNPAMLQLFGADNSGQLLGKSLFKLFHHLYHPVMQDRINKLLNGEVVRTIEGKILRLDNTVVDVEISASAFKDQDGLAIQVLLRNITDRKDAEDKLLQAYQRLNLLIDNSPLAVIEWDSDFYIRRWAGEAQEVFGWSSDEVLGKRIDELPWIYDNSKGVEHVIADMLSRRKPGSINKICNIRKDGKVIHCEWYNASIYDKTGRLISVLSQVLDVSDRVLVEEALRQSERLYRAIGELIDYGVWVCNSEGKNIYTSESFLKMSGLTQQECSGFGWIKSLHPDDVEKTIASWKECVHTGGVWDIEHRLLGVDGMWHPILVRGIPVRNEEGKIICWAGINLDIKRLKEAEDILRRDKETLKKLVIERSKELGSAQIELSRTKRLSDIGMLAATVAHELRNPLTTITMATHNIKRKAKDMLLLKSHIQNIEKKVAEGDQIINNLLFYSRIKPPNFEKLNVYFVIQECIDESHRQNKENVPVINNFSSLQDVLIEGDTVQVKEIFSNILNNSIDAVGEKNGEIEISALNNSEHIEVQIKDNGSGIKPEDLERVFDPFFTTKTKGTGLGLAVCKQLVELHKGTIKIKSEFGQGSIVIITLPKKNI